MSLNITQLPSVLGAEVSGLSLGQPLAPETASAIVAAWLRLNNLVHVPTKKPGGFFGPCYAAMARRRLK